MNVLAPVSTLMTTKLVTVNPKDNLDLVKEVFEKNKIHHLPVVRYKKLVGIISKSDLLYFIKGHSNGNFDEILNQTRLRNCLAEDIMTKGIAKLAPNDRLNIALKIFQENLFHAIPIVKDDELVGILTTYDIIKAVSEAPILDKY